MIKLIKNHIKRFLIFLLFTGKSFCAPPGSRKPIEKGFVEQQADTLKALLEPTTSKLESYSRKFVNSCNAFLAELSVHAFRGSERFATVDGNLVKFDLRGRRLLAVSLILTEEGHHMAASITECLDQVLNTALSILVSGGLIENSPVHNEIVGMLNWHNEKGEAPIVLYLHVGSKDKIGPDFMLNSFIHLQNEYEYREPHQGTSPHLVYTVLCFVVKGLREFRDASKGLFPKECVMQCIDLEPNQEGLEVLKALNEMFKWQASLEEAVTKFRESVDYNMLSEELKTMISNAKWGISEESFNTLETTLFQTFHPYEGYKNVNCSEELYSIKFTDLLIAYYVTDRPMFTELLNSCSEIAGLDTATTLNRILTESEADCFTDGIPHLNYRFIRKYCTENKHRVQKIITQYLDKIKTINEEKHDEVKNYIDEMCNFDSESISELEEILLVPDARKLKGLLKFKREVDQYKARILSKLRIASNAHAKYRLIYWYVNSTMSLERFGFFQCDWLKTKQLCESILFGSEEIFDFSSAFLPTERKLQYKYLFLRNAGATSSMEDHIRNDFDQLTLGLQCAYFTYFAEVWYLIALQRDNTKLPAYLQSKRARAVQSMQYIARGMTTPYRLFNKNDVEQYTHTQFLPNSKKRFNINDKPDAEGNPKTGVIKKSAELKEFANSYRYQRGVWEKSCLQNLGFFILFSIVSILAIVLYVFYFYFICLIFSICAPLSALYFLYNFLSILCTYIYI